MFFLGGMVDEIDSPGSAPIGFDLQSSSQLRSEREGNIDEGVDYENIDSGRRHPFIASTLSPTTHVQGARASKMGPPTRSFDCSRRNRPSEERLVAFGQP